MPLLLQSEICSDFVLATILSIIRKSLNIIQVIVPILLILSGTIQFMKMVLNPDDDRNGKKSFINSIMAAVIVFFLPTLINLTMSILNETGEVGIKTDKKRYALNLSSCWTAVENTQSEMDSVKENGGSKSSTISKEQSKKKKTLSNNTTTSSSNNQQGSGQAQQSTTTNPNPSNTASGTAIVQYAKQFIGNPYKWGGNSLTAGTDCSGFIHLVYANFGINVPRQSTALQNVGTAIASINEAKAGDIICYPNHVALFEGDGLKIVHAKNRASGITEDNATYNKNIITIRRVLN